MTSQGPSDEFITFASFHKKRKLFFAPGLYSIQKEIFSIGRAIIFELALKQFKGP
jgi:hypothetical protein